jgi:hypothetical protein
MIVVTQLREQLHIETAESTGDAHAASARLPRCATSVNSDQHVDVLQLARGLERAEEFSAILFVLEILLNIALVNDDFTASFAKADARYRRLASSGSEGVTRHFVSFDCDHELFPR